MDLTQFVVLHLSNLHHLLDLKTQSPMASMDCPYICSTRREYISECNDPFAEFKSITSSKPTELPNYSAYCHVHLMPSASHNLYFFISVIYTICWYLKHSLQWLPWIAHIQVHQGEDIYIWVQWPTCVRATAVGRGAERNAERNAVLAGDPKGLVYYVMID